MIGSKQKVIIISISFSPFGTHIINNKLIPGITANNHKMIQWSGSGKIRIAQSLAGGWNQNQISLLKFPFNIFPDRIFIISCGKIKLFFGINLTSDKAVS